MKKIRPSHNTFGIHNREDQSFGVSMRASMGIAPHLEASLHVFMGGPRGKVVGGAASDSRANARCVYRPGGNKLRSAAGFSAPREYTPLLYYVLYLMREGRRIKIHNH